MKKTATQAMTAAEFDRKFDDGEDLSAYIDSDSILRPGLETQRVNVDFPAWIIKSLDLQSKVIGVSRQALIKMWVSERLKEELRSTKSSS